MGFGPFILLSLFYAVIGIRVVAQLVKSWRPTFDRQFTTADRSLVDQAAFFVLLPISVAVHELAHAVAVRGFGGEVVGWGFYVFAGFVSYDPRPFSDLDRILVALAGPLVSILLGLAALAVVFLRRPPLRAAYNELLIQFATLSIINAAVFYPLLDIATGLGGDWSQIYRGGVPMVSVVIFIFHVALLVGGFWAYRNPAIQARIATLTGAPTGTERRFMGGVQRTERPFVAPSAEAERVADAARRVASGWPSPVRITVEPGVSGSRFALSVLWGGENGALTHGILVRLPAGSGLEILGRLVEASGSQRTQRLESLRSFGAVPDTDALTLAMRLAMEDVERRSARAA